MEIGVFVCEGYDANAKCIGQGVNNGERNSVDSDGTFFNGDVVAWVGEMIFPTAIEVFDCRACPSGIHMSLNDMPIKAIANFGAAF